MCVGISKACGCASWCSERVRPREATEFFLARIERLNPQARAFRTVAAERGGWADARATGAARPPKAAAIAALRRSPIVKDLTWTRDIRHHDGLENYFFNEKRPPALKTRNGRWCATREESCRQATTPELGGPPTRGRPLPPANNHGTSNTGAGWLQAAAGGAVASRV